MEQFGRRRRGCGSAPSRPSRMRLGAAAALSGLAASALGGCSSGILDPQGPVGHSERLILFDSLAIMLAIVVPTIAAGLGFAWWFRDGNARAKYRPDWTYSGRIELVVWSIPLLTITFLGGLIWTGSRDLDPARPIPSKTPPLNVQVVSLDWKWLFIYPDQGVAAVNTLVVPAATPVHFTLTSGSVMNSFFVPQLGSMIYTMNGMADNLWLQADHPGVYYGQSSHFSGDGFSDMHFNVNAVGPADFNSWVSRTRVSGPVLDAQGYRLLERQSRNVQPFTYRAAQPDLFKDILMQKLPPGPGPGPGSAGQAADVHPKGG
jgi:cytochrome o ubiquinol oxidase subunit II